MRYFLQSAVLGSVLFSGSLWAGSLSLDQEILQYQNQWAHINYQVPANQRADQFSALAKAEQPLIAAYPNRAEPLIWHAIILSSLAGAEGGFSALGLAKEARNELLAAKKMDPTAMHGSIETSLGALYAKVPGWPIGFGSDAKAEAYLTEAVHIDPTGIDPNYFYADFLYSQHQYRLAMQVLEKALAAPARPDRPLADQGRRQEIRALMAKIQTEHGDALAAGH